MLVAGIGQKNDGRRFQTLDEFITLVLNERDDRIIKRCHPFRIILCFHVMAIILSSLRDYSQLNMP
jgi:hypothetical protein